ncbi:MAG: DUF3857 domain-containing protein [Candidatus Acidiferrum sp.]
MKSIRVFFSASILVATTCFLCAAPATPRSLHRPPQKPAEHSPSKSQENAKEKSASKAAPEIPARIELLETRVRFEADGSSRKEVHARVKINDELGVRQFGRLSFDFNRAFQSVEIPLLRITHPSGGTVDVLPSAITDQPNPAVVNAPAYQDVRVKSVRILGLEPGDTLEYRVITTTSHAPLAPDFWLDHTFDRSGVVSHEIFLIDAPAPRLRIRINPDTPAIIEKSGAGDTARVSYRWDLQQDKLKPEPTAESAVDVALTTFSSWSRLSRQISKSENMSFSTLIYQQADAKVGGDFKRGSPQSLYHLVSQKIATIDLPLELSLSVRRSAEQILESGYGTSEEKAYLLSILMSRLAAQPKLVMYGHGSSLQAELPRPSLLAGTLLVAKVGSKQYFLDPGLEVAPFGAIPARLRGQKSLNIAETSADTNDCFTALPLDLPFSSSQRVDIQANLDPEGKLTAKVSYAMRGDNELLLRVAFHQTPKENWKNVAQLLALSDGFRGQITNVTASDPYETHDPFKVEYAIAQPKFVNWSKKPVRVPALLPLLGLPDPAQKATPGNAGKPINLGTPLDVEVSAAVHLPSGTTAHIPTGTSVERDFATYSSRYSAKDATMTASRHLHFILREIPVDRAVDYDAFLQAVQNDESQVFTLERADASAAKPSKP